MLKQNINKLEYNKVTMICGFTLAEIVLTLMIIGIVSAMTIPAVINNTREVELKARWKKAYATVSQAWLQTVGENPSVFTGKGGWVCTWTDGKTGNYNVEDGRIDALKEKFSIVKTCVDQPGCWPKKFEYHRILGYYSEAEANDGKTKLGWVTPDNMCWNAIFYRSPKDDAHIAVDINCDKKPNKIGEDIFSMFLGADGMIYFAIDDISTTGKPVSSGNVCPLGTYPYSLEGYGVTDVRMIDFRDGLTN